MAFLRPVGKGGALDPASSLVSPRAASTGQGGYMCFVGHVLCLRPVLCLVSPLASSPGFVPWDRTTLLGDEVKPPLEAGKCGETGLRC